MADGYVQDGETVYAEEKVKYAKFGESRRGSLTCTDSRLVFQSTWKTLDISLSDVNVIEIDRNNDAIGYMIMGGLFVLGSVLWLLFPFGLGPISDSAINVLAGIGILIGIVSLGVGIWKWRKRKLVVHTPSGDFAFSGTDLTQFAHAVRGAST